MRRKIPLPLADGNEYVFTERNREDVDYAHLQDAVREHRMKQLHKNFNEDTDLLLSLLLAEQQRVYGDVEIGIYIFSNKPELQKICFDSFKIANPGIKLEQFIPMIPHEGVDIIFEQIKILESPEINLENELKLYAKHNKEKTFKAFLDQCSARQKGLIASIVVELKKKKAMTA
jgi:hypothetical protein